MSERLSRHERRVLAREDEHYLAMPVNIGGDPRRVEAHVRHVVHLFQSDRSPSPCSEVIAHIFAVYEKTVPLATSGSGDCKRGCSHCCFQRVTVTAPEAFYIANHIRSDRKKVARVIETSRQIGGMSQDQRLRARVPCPLLSETLCSIYGTRPIGCRGAISLDANACIAAYIDLKDNNITMPLDHIKLMNVMRLVLGAAMTLVGLPMTGYELIGAVAAALTENAEARWRAGEDIFASVDIDSSGPSTFFAAIENMARHVAPTV